MCVYLPTKFQVFSIILTTFKKNRIILNPPPSNKHTPQNEPLKCPPTLGLNSISKSCHYATHFFL